MKILAALQDAGLIKPLSDGWEPHEWAEYQYPSDSSAERQKRYRDRQRDGSVTSQPPSPSRHSDAADTEQNREEQKEEEEKPAQSAPILSDQIWGVGIAYLTGAGVKSPRPILGKWRRDYGDAKLLSVLIEAQKAGVSEPVAWITAALMNGGRKPGGPPAEKRIWSKNGIPYVWCEFTNDWIQDIGLG